MLTLNVVLIEYASNSFALNIMRDTRFNAEVSVFNMDTRTWAKPAPAAGKGYPHTLPSAPSTLHPTPYTLHPTPYTRHPTPDTLHPTLYTPIAAL